MYGIKERFGAIMKEAIILLNNHLRDVFEKSTTWFIILLLVQLITIWLVIYIYLDIENSSYHYYMNTKTSLEGIHHVKIDSFDGKIEKELTTEEQLLRKHNRKWHLKYLFK